MTHEGTTRTPLTLFVGHAPPNPETWPYETYTAYVMEILDGVPQGDTLIRPVRLVKRYTTYVPRQPNRYGILTHTIVGWAEA